MQVQLPGSIEKQLYDSVNRGAQNGHLRINGTDAYSGEFHGVNLCRQDNIHIQERIIMAAPVYPVIIPSLQVKPANRMLPRLYSCLPVSEN